ncbi:MAG: tyrosine-protein phosphatase [archaeon]|nr:tyrosine-protein phosphatase [archaeon]
MGKNKRIILVGVIAVIVLASAVAGAIVLTDSDSKQGVFTGETIGKNSFANPIFDLTLEDLKNAGYAEGDTFDIEIKGTIVHDATLTHGFLGLFMFDTYLNTEKDGHLAAGTYWDNLLPNDIGNTVTITHVGHNNDYDKLDRLLVDYSHDIADYGGDEAVFANFYEVTGGDIKDGRLYRSYNPYTAGNARLPYVNKLAEEAGIEYMATLSMSSEDILAQIAKGAEGYCIDLFEKGQSSATNIGYKYFINKNEVKLILMGMADNDGPYQVHCNVGRDRTGFMVTLLQALCGASEDDMMASAANAYVNLYRVDPNSEEYKVIVNSTYCRNIYYICNHDRIDGDLVKGTLPVDWTGKDVNGIDLKKAAYDYCTEYLEIDGSVVDRLIANLCV